MKHYVNLYSLDRLMKNHQTNVYSFFLLCIINTNHIYSLKNVYFFFEIYRKKGSQNESNSNSNSHFRT